VEGERVAWKSSCRPAGRPLLMQHNPRQSTFCTAEAKLISTLTKSMLLYNHTAGSVTQFLILL